MFRKKTDEEYIKSVRKAVRWARKLAFLYAASCGLVIIGIATLLKAFRSVAGVATATNDQASLGLRLGILFGVFIGSLSTCGVLALINFVIFYTGDRKDKLLLKYHDALAARTAPDTTEQPTPEPPEERPDDDAT